MNQRVKRNRQILESCISAEKSWNKKLTEIPIVVDALGTVPRKAWKGD